MSVVVYALKTVPPLTMWIVESVDAVVIVLPAELVVVISWAGTVFLVVIVEPASFVVVSSTTVLVWAVVWNADVTFVVVWPAESVVVRVTDTITPVFVVGAAELLVVCTIDRELMILGIEDTLRRVSAAVLPSDVGSNERAGVFIGRLETLCPLRVFVIASRDRSLLRTGGADDN